MRIAISTRDGTRICGHAGRARRWQIHQEDGSRHLLELAREQLFHYWEGREQSHPLEQVDVVVTASAGEGFQKRLARHGVRLVVTGERDAERAIAALLAGAPLAKPKFNPMLLACKLFDHFGKH